MIWFRLGVGVLFMSTFFIFKERQDDRRLSSKTIPSIISTNLADVNEPLGLTDTPFFWHIPKSAGSTATEFFFCMGLTLACQAGKLRGHENDKTLETFQPWINRKAVNVDTSTIAGLQSAQSRGFAQSLLADVVVSGHLYDVSDIFDTIFRLRVTTLFRHPIDRATSLFYYLQDAHWEKHYAPETKDWTITQYVQSKLCPKNWMISKLLHDGKYSTGDQAKDLEIAKTILRDKFLIGLTDRIEESFERFDKYFNFDDDPGTVKMCSSKLLSEGNGINIHNHPEIQHGSKDWKALEDANMWDIRLYEYAVFLYHKQADLFVQDA